MGKNASVTTIDAKRLHAKDMAENPWYPEEYEALESEFALIDALIRSQHGDLTVGKAS